MHDPAIHRAVLHAWANGSTAPEISASLNVNVSFVRSLVKRTRDAGGNLEFRGAKAHTTEVIEVVLDGWAIGLTDAEIRKITGLQAMQIHHILRRSRDNGDLRAARRMTVRHNTDFPETKRKPAEVRMLREQVLVLWQSGLRAAVVAIQCGIETEYVYSIVKNARDAGDCRAHRRWFAS